MRGWIVSSVTAVVAASSVALIAPTVSAVGEPLSGTVTDTLGNPLDGVLVSLSDGMFGYTDTTDAAGSYDFTVPDGTYQLSFTKPGYRGEVYDEVPYTMGMPMGLPVTVVGGAPQVIDESLLRVPLITGRLVDGGGSPIQANVSVEMVPFGAGSGALSNPDGTFTIELPEPGTYRAAGWGAAWLRTYAPSTLDANSASTVTVDYDQSTSVGDITLLEGGSISGVVTAGGTPLGGATVFAGAVPPPPGGMYGTGSTVTASDGSYTIAGLAPGTYQVTFSAVGYLSENYDNQPTSGMPSFQPVMVAEGVATPGINADLAAGATVSGVVRDPGGAVLGGVSVQVIDQSVSGFPSSVGSAVTAPDGSYTISGLPAVNGLVTASSPTLGNAFITGGGRPTSADVLALTAGAALTADLQFAAVGSVSGTVTVPGGAPLAGATVSLEAIIAPGIVWFPAVFSQHSRSVSTDANGEFIATGMAAGAYRVVASPPGPASTLAFEYYDSAYTEAAAAPVVVSAGGSAGPLAIELAEGATVSGTVTDATGAPVVGTFVVVMGPNGEFGASATTDSNGVYTATGVPPGDWLVFANGSGSSNSAYHPSAADAGDASVLTLGLGDALTGIDVQLITPARMVATILDPAGNPIPLVGSPYAFWGVGFCQPPGVPVPTFSQCSSGPVGGASTATKPADGQWVGEGISAGTYNVAAFVAFPIAVSDYTTITVGSGDLATCTFQVNGPASCTVTNTGGQPDDDDGVPDAVEDGVNGSGDGNGDGTPDSQQDNVASVPSPVVGGGYVTVAAPAGSTLSSVTVADPADYPAPPPGATLDNGVIAYTVAGVAPGATVDIDVHLTTPTAASGYAKVQGGVWVPLPGTAFTKVSSTHFVLHLTDGGVGDEDGQANGVIVDPGSPLDLDTTGPTISCPTSVSFLLHSPDATLTASIADQGSGVASSTVTVPVAVNALGPATVLVTATDLAGNTTTAPCDYMVGVQVEFIGGIAGDEPNDANGGSTVVVRWRTTDALGRPVDASSLVSVTTTAVSCSTGTAIGATMPARSTNGRLIDAGRGKWQFNWKTDRNWDGCRQLEVTVIGGDVAVAVFEFDRHGCRRHGRW